MTPLTREQLAGLFHLGRKLAITIRQYQVLTPPEPVTVLGRQTYGFDLFDEQRCVHKLRFEPGHRFASSVDTSGNSVVDVTDLRGITVEEFRLL